MLHNDSEACLGVLQLGTCILRTTRNGDDYGEWIMQISAKRTSDVRGSHAMTLSIVRGTSGLGVSGSRGLGLWISGSLGLWVSGSLCR